MRIGKPFPVERDGEPLARQVEALTERIRDELETLKEPTPPGVATEAG